MQPHTLDIYCPVLTLYSHHFFFFYFPYRLLYDVIFSSLHMALFAAHKLLETNGTILQQLHWNELNNALVMFHISIHGCTACHFFPWVSNILNLNKDIIQPWVRLLTPMNFFLIFQCIVQTGHQYIIQANQMRSKSQRG